LPTYIEKPRQLEFCTTTSTFEALVVVCLPVKIGVVTNQLPVACYTLGQALVRAILANGVSILGHKGTTKSGVALVAREAVFVPVFTKGGGNHIVYIPVTPCAYPLFKALLVVWFAILDNVLSCNTTIAFGTRKKVASTIRTQGITAVFKEGPTKWLAAIIASEVVRMERLAKGIHVLSVKLLSALVAFVGTTTTTGGRQDLDLSCKVAHVTGGRCGLMRGRVD